MKTLLVLLGLAALAAKGDTTPMIQSFTFGRCDVIALQDKPHSMPNRLFEATAPKEVVDRLAPDGASPASMSMFIVRKDGEIALFDAGTSFATLKAGLDAIGIAPESIGAIFITHMHFDHIGGLLDGGKAAFPKASLYIAKRELAHWLKTGADAKKVADAYAGRLVEFDFGTPLPMGIVPRDAPGHTPGHTVYELPDLLVVGDLLHAAAVQLPRPDISIAFDADAKTAAETRRSFLAEAAAGTRPIAAVHLPFPGIGRIATSGEGFRLDPPEQDATTP